MLLAELRRDVDVRDVVAGRGVDAVEGLQEQPFLAEPGRDRGKAGPSVADEAVGEVAPIVAGIGVIEAGVALEGGLARLAALPGERHREHGVAGCGALPQAPALEVAPGQVDAEADGVRRLVLGEAHDLRGGDGGAEDAEDGAGVEAARHHRRDEVGGHPLHHLVAGHEAGHEVAPGGALGLGRRERAGDDARAGMQEHAERVPLAAGQDQLGVGEDRAGSGGRRAIHQEGGAARHTRLFPGDELDGLPARGQLRAEERRREGLKRQPLGAVDHLRRQVLVAQAGHPPRKLAADRRRRVGLRAIGRLDSPRGRGDRRQAPGAEDAARRERALKQAPPGQSGFHGPRNTTGVSRDQARRISIIIEIIETR